MINDSAATKSHLITSYEVPAKKDDRTVGEVLAGFIITLPIFFAAGVWTAFVLWKLYGWFAVPIGAPVFNLAIAWGLWMIFRVLTMSLVPEREGSGTVAALGRTLGMAVVYAIVLLFGWIVSGWV